MQQQNANRNQAQKNILLSPLSVVEQEKVRGGGADRTMFDTIMKCDVDIRSDRPGFGTEDIQASSRLYA